MSVLVTREYKTELISRNAETGIHTFVISDESKDSHGTVFRMSGWNFERFAKNPVVTYGHPDPNGVDPDVIIGRAVVRAEGGKLIADVEYDMENPLAAKIRSKVDRGFLNMTSIRAYVNDAERGAGEDRETMYFIDQELLDFGIVMHGSNKNAMKQRDIMLALGKEDNEPTQGENTDTILTDHTDEDQVATTENAARLEEARELISKTFFNLKKVK
jgi:hypothetical protein